MLKKFLNYLNKSGIDRGELFSLMSAIATSEHIVFTKNHLSHDRMLCSDDSDWLAIISALGASPVTGTHKISRNQQMRLLCDALTVYRLRHKAPEQGINSKGVPSTLFSELFAGVSSSLGVRCTYYGDSDRSDYEKRLKSLTRTESDRFAEFIARKYSENRVLTRYILEKYSNKHSGGAESAYQADNIHPRLKPLLQSIPDSEDLHRQIMSSF